MVNDILDDMPYTVETEVLCGLDKNDNLIDIYVDSFYPDIVIEMEENNNDKWIQVYP